MIGPRRIWSAGATLLALAAGACDGGPQAGELDVFFDSPDPDDRAILFEMSATEPQTIEDVTAVCAGCQEFTHQESNRRISVIVVGTFGAGPVARITVSDITKLSAYTLTLESVADLDLNLQDVDDRSLTFDR